MFSLYRSTFYLLEAEMPFLKGIDLGKQEALPALQQCDRAAAAAQQAQQTAVAFLKAKMEALETDQ